MLSFKVMKALKCPGLPGKAREIYFVKVRGLSWNLKTCQKISEKGQIQINVRNFLMRFLKNMSYHNIHVLEINWLSNYKINCLSVWLINGSPWTWYHEKSLNLANGVPDLKKSYNFVPPYSRQSLVFYMILKAFPQVDVQALFTSPACCCL